METKQEYYSIFNEETQSLLTISERSNEGGYACGSKTVTFETDSYYREFLVDTLEQAIRAKLFDTPWYNSDEERPGHGYVDMDRCQVVKVTKVVTIEPAGYEHPKSYTHPRALVNCYGVSDPYKFENKGKSKDKYTLLVIDGEFQSKEHVQVGDLFARDSYAPFERVVAIVDLDPKLTKERPLAFGIVLERAAQN